MAAAAASPPRLGLVTGSLPHAGVPLLYISAGLQEVGLWDVLDGRCHQVGIGYMGVRAKITCL